MSLIEYPVRYVTVEPDRAGQRIDNFLLGQFKGVPRSFIYRILRKGEVRVNKKRIRAEYKLQDGDEVRLPPVKVEQEAVIAPSKHLDIVKRLTDAVIYETSQMLVINKPCGIAVHGGSGLDYGVIEALRSGRDDLKYLELVHRLDRDTSGCLMVAKKRSALRCLHEQLRLKTTQKRYWALVHGIWPEKLTNIREPLLKNILKSGERMVKVSDEGKPSHTSFRVIRTFPENNCTLIEASPHTGRTHQIRVHCAFAGHPIVMDPKYGNDQADAKLAFCGLNRMFLHASSITFEEPEQGRKVTVEAMADEVLSGALERLK